MATVTKTPGSAEATDKLLKTPVERVIVVDGKRIIKADIAKWKRAIDAARSELMPRRRDLYDLYDTIIYDGHLESVIDKFMAHTLNKRVTFVPTKDNEGMDISEIEEYVLDTPWFRDIIKAWLRSRLQGHTLAELVVEGGIVTRVQEADRRNVVPERGFLALNYSNLDGDGIYYLSDPYWSRYLLSFGGRKDLGKLLTAAMLVLYKRGDVGDWSQFNELFGMPFREFNYNPNVPGDREKLDDAAKNSGSAGYVVTPEGTSLKFHTAGQSTGVQSYKDFAAYCNEELSKLFLGNTLTTQQSDTGARALGEVHQDSENETLLSHLIECEYALNWEVKDKLIALGYTDLAKGRFSFQSTSAIPLDKRIAIDIQLSSRIAIPDSYWYETYGIPRPEGAEASMQEPVPAPAPAPVPGSGGGGNKPAAKTKVVAMLCCGGMHEGSTPRADYSPSTTDLQLMRTMYDGDGRKYDLETFRTNARNLINGLMNGLAPSMEYGGVDTDAAVAMQLNINRFAFTKNLAQMVELNRALKASDTYEQFRSQAATVLGTFNDQYLRTEYNLAKTVGQTTRDWLRIEKDKELFPYVRYKTVGDANVRASHAALDNRVFSLADPSWKALNPPNGYGCRCWLEQIQDPGRDTAISGPEAQRLMGEEWGKMKSAGFAVNRADSGVVFDLANEYVEQLKGVDTGINSLTAADAGLPDFKAMTKGKDAMPTGAEGWDRLLDDVKAGGHLTVRMGKIPFAMTEDMLKKAGQPMKDTHAAAWATLSAPDELWMTDTHLTAIKAYKGQLMAVRATYKDGRLEVTGWDTDKAGDTRKGLPIHLGA